MSVRNLNCVACAAAFLLNSGVANAESSIDPLQLLVESSAQRVAIADQVALSKWDSAMSVEDPVREAAVIASAVAEGRGRQLAGEDVARFFKAQIEANKLVQYSLLSTWRFLNYAPPHAPVNLVGTVRPELDRLQTTMVLALAEASPVRSSKTCASEVATAVGRYAFAHRFDDAVAPQLDIQRLHLIGVQRAMAGFCPVY